MSVYNNQKKHTKKRALERYGLNFSNKDLECIVEKIENKEYIFKGKISNSRDYILIKHKKIIALVYDNSRKSIATILKLNHKQYCKDTGETVCGNKILKENK